MFILKDLVRVVNILSYFVENAIYNIFLYAWKNITLNFYMFRNANDVFFYSVKITP